MCTQYLLEYFQNSQYSVLTWVLFLSTRFIPDYFMINLRKKLGLGWDQTRGPPSKLVNRQLFQISVGRKTFGLMQWTGLTVKYYILVVHTVEPALSGHSKIDKTKILMTIGSLMKVTSIAECSLWSILQYFWPALSDNWSWKLIFVLFESDCYGQVLLYSYSQYYVCQTVKICVWAKIWWN